MAVASRLIRRVRGAWQLTCCWLRLRPRVSGRLKLRGAVERISVHADFRCDGDLWLGVYADAGSITIEPGVSASGPLIITAVQPLRIGAATLFGPNVLVTDHYHGNLRDPAHRALAPSSRPLYSPGCIDIGVGAQLGANSVVLSPTRIGAGAIVAANAVVKGDVAAGSIYTGLASRRSGAGPRDLVGE